MKIINKKYHLLLKLVLILMLFQSCKSYKKVTMNELASENSKGTIKVTMSNGYKYIFENIESNGDDFYGITKENNEVVKILLLKEEVKNVQVYDKKSTLFLNFMAITILVGSVILGTTAFGS